MNTVRSITYGQRQVKLITLFNERVFQIKDNKTNDYDNVFFIKEKAAKEVYDKKEEEVYSVSKV